MKQFNQLMDKLLKSQQFLLVLSLVFALLLFFNVNQNFNFIVLENTTEYVMTGVKLEVESNPETQILEGNPAAIDFRITGKKADVERFKNERNIQAKIDVKEYLGENIGVPILYTTNKDYNVVIAPLVKEVSVNIYKKVTIEKEVKISTEELPSGYKLKDAPVLLDSEGNITKKISITGSEKQTQKIKIVEFKVKPELIVGQKTDKIEPRFLDEAGNTIPIEAKKYTIQYIVEVEA